MGNNNVPGKIIQQTAEHIRQKLSGDSSGHDWWHIYRVWTLAVRIGQEEKADLFVVQLAALLHDIADWKFHGGDDTVGPRLAREWLESLHVDELVISHVCQIIKDMSFKGAGVSTLMKTVEGKIVQDADRLDALGAVGIARTFAYGGRKNRLIYDPGIPPEKHASFEQYKNSTGPTINHFYEKLLLLKGLMNTSTAKKIAEERHRVMEEFLDAFLKEWDGVR
ncbi:HD domain-containing protein [Candidatus Woesearchaeota archaeon]|nr:HD domain-containing protein [Candidatus Woesearchaeota archaeon]